MSPDQINGVFEFIGALFTLKNALQVVKDEGYAGIWLPGILFFFSWGFWNLFYYPSLGQMWSFAGGVALVTANLIWATTMWAYGKSNAYRS